MIEFIKTPYSIDTVRAMLNPLINKWFFSKFKDFSLPQLYAVKEIQDSNNILVSAPTGTGKTLTAFLSVLNQLIDLSQKQQLQERVYCIYISPLKALSNDIFVNLTEPLEELNKLAGKDLGIRVGVRTGDTSVTDRSKMLHHPPHILITTPESIALILSSPKFKELVKDIKWVIIDEIHALAENKRGVHLSLSLERLQKENDFVRIGLSATISPIEEIAKFLVGHEQGKERNCKIVDISLIKQMDLKIICPAPDLINTNHEEVHTKLYETIHDLVQEHKTTLVFTNTRAATERVVHYLKEKFPKHYTENIGAHHGSLSKEHRFDIENRLRKGELKCIVSSTSLELGIDIGYIDLVICLSSPKSIARMCQRLGRSGHRLHDKIKGRIIVMDRDDLVECAVMLKHTLERNIDKIHIPTNCLDVLAQQMLGIIIVEQIHIEELFTLIKRSYCYKDLEKKDFLEIIDYLSGKYALEARHVYAKIWHDEETGMVGKRGKLTRVIYSTNIGTIAEEGFVIVKIKETTIGYIDESFLERLKPRDIFILGGQVYEFLFARGLVAQVKLSINRPPTVPSWFSETLPLSFDLSLNIEKFRRFMSEHIVKDKDEIIKFIKEYLYVNEVIAEPIYQYFKEQSLFSEIPHDKLITVELFNEGDKKYVVFHTLFGRRVNDCLSRAIALIISKVNHKDVEIGINDNGFYISSKDKVQVLQALKMLKSNELKNVLEVAIEKSEIFKRRFRHCATRSLMILRNYKGKTRHIGRQQVSSMILMSALRSISNNFFVLKEARREVLEDLMDIENTTKIIKEIELGNIKIKQIPTSMPSPFAFNIVLQGRLDVLKIQDRIEFLRNMHNMVLAKISKQTEKSS